MVRSDEPHGRIIATFISDRETIPVVDLMFESLIQYSAKNDIQLNPKWLTLDKWDPYLVAAKKYFPNTQAILCDWHEADALKKWFTKNLNDQWLRDQIFYQFRFVKRSRDQEEFDERKVTILDAEKLQAAVGIMKLDTARHAAAELDDDDVQHAAAELDDDDVQHAAAELDDDDVQHAVAELDDDDIQHAAAELDNDDDVQNAVAELDDNDVSKESSRLSESREIKAPETNDDYFIKQHGRVLCVTRKNGKVACPCSFASFVVMIARTLLLFASLLISLKHKKSYIRQKNANGHSKDELKLPQKRGPKNKRKSRLVPGESIQLRDATLYEPYHKVQIVEIIGDGEVIVDFTLENGDKDQHIVQLANIIGYDDEQLQKKQSQPKFADALSSSSFGSHENKQWSEAKILWTESLPSYTKLVNAGQINLFGGLSERFFEQFFQDSLDQNLLVTKSIVTTMCDSNYCPRKVLPLTNYYDIILVKTHVCVLPGSNYFETCLKQWKEPYIVSCGSEFKTKNGEKPKNIPMNAFRFNKYTSVETGKTKYLYICSGRATSTRQIDQWLPLILAINITGISINEVGICLENKDLPEEISFPPDDIQKKQRYSQLPQ
ncbi:hypothetical protein F8M41_005917 [Gigaspora margarita]|uniref:Transposase n=1 Tax=Gigaspora margarita TaxID=4874 RepID=A0A8H3X8V7_GIGMA|nr:hypothetical protein F8M41_005917 [Gigaspora margarita]